MRRRREEHGRPAGHLLVGKVERGGPGGGSPPVYLKAPVNAPSGVSVGMFRLAREALATRDLRKLQLANLATGVGGWAFMVSLAVHAYAVGGAAAVGLAALVRMAPAGLAAPLTGLLADRFPRRDVLLASALIRAALLIAAAFAPFPLLLVIAVAFTIAQTAHKPAQAALLPHLTANPAAANAVWASIDNAAFVLGALAGGTIVAALGVPAAFVAAALTFVIAALLLLRIPRDRVMPVEATSTLAGLRVVARDPRLRVLVGVLSVSTLIEGMVDVLVVVAALDL